MEVIHGHQQLHRSLTQAVVSIGNFDGVHLGHQRILAENLKLAHELGGTSVVYTFRPHPQVALRPENQVPMLCTYEEKIALIETLGIEVLIEEPFSREFSTTVAEDFFNQVLLGKLSVAAIVVGYDFAFGKERSGSLERLESWCRASAVRLVVVSAQRIQGEVVSSSRIRQHLMQGDVEQAQVLLGRPFSYQGVVVKGEGRGRQLGFPTANLKLENKLSLPHGVYATWSCYGGKKFPSVTNIGVRPTFYPDAIESEFPALVETHVLDQNVDLYGVPFEVQFKARLRPERKFPSIQDLKEQINRDIASARQVLAVGH